MQKQWNKRYLAYAASQGMGPEQVLSRDRKTYPGGCMAGFICWMLKTWRRWAAEAGEIKRGGWNGVWDSRQHEAFDQWLDEKYIYSARFGGNSSGGFY